MKKLNRKGFTLIELLAVIVILAIIIALVFPQITNVIDNSKISTIHSNAKGIVSWWNTTISADAIVSDESQRQIPSDIPDKITTTWQCVGSITSTKKPGATFASVAGISESDYVLTGTAEESVGSDTCSAVRYSDATRELEVLLVAASGGKNYIAGKVTYAFSTDDSGKSVAAS